MNEINKPILKLSFQSLNVKIKNHSRKIIPTLTVEDYFQYEQEVQSIQEKSLGEKIVALYVLQEFSELPSTNDKQKQESKVLISKLKESLPKTLEQVDYKSIMSEILFEQTTIKQSTPTSKAPASCSSHTAAKMIKMLKGNSSEGSYLHSRSSTINRKQSISRE